MRIPQHMESREASNEECVVQGFSPGEDPPCVQTVISPTVISPTVISPTVISPTVISPTVHIDDRQRQQLTETYTCLCTSSLSCTGVALPTGSICNGLSVY
ncbi:hypothetical protein KUCAC02_021787 [Chaenocephalus aceratus]|uniref:Uncharacterized protein n=1 Tax=Chaenocephalus aceratus TaxID=36190 RepID=A0ACB9XGP1_CHAAC|nr:hypothetical protein KUCAC02_021787 [Chaenocephalus aceratus]